MPFLNVEFLVHPVGFVDALKVKRAKESGGLFLGGQRTDQ